MSFKRDILIFIDWYLPGYKAGGPVRSIVNMVDHLSNEYNFFIVTRDREYLETTPYTEVKSNSWNAISNHVSVFYASTINESYGLWKDILNSKEWSCVYINGIYSLKYSLLPLIAAKRVGCKHIIVAPRGMVAASAIGVKRGKKELFLTLSRWLGLFKGVKWHATERREFDDIEKIFGRKCNVVTAPNLSRKMEFTFTEGEKEVNRLNLCSFARISPEKNTLYAIQALKDVASDCFITFDLFGQIYDQTYWESCLVEIKGMGKNIIINYKGVVPSEEVGGVMERYHGLLMPTRGENFGHVILESFMASRPVVISDQTPWKGLENKKAGWDIDLAKREDFKHAIEQLSRMGQLEYNELCLGAFKVAEGYVNDRSVLESYKVLLG